MIAVDTGLLALALNRYAPEHARAAELLESLANGERPWAIPWSVAHEFLELVTNRHGVARALGAEDAWSFLDQLARSPSLRFLGPGPGHAAAAADVLALRDPDAPRGLDPSFATAVILREHGVREILSTDGEMRHWRFLDVRDPLHGEPWGPDVRPARRYRTLSGRGDR
jgi:predicted nucleic acid-binding protein